MFPQTYARSALRIADLKERGPNPSRLLNVKIPVELFDAIGKLASRLDASKTLVVTALLNAGLEIAAKQTGRRRA